MPSPRPGLLGDPIVRVSLYTAPVLVVVALATGLLLHGRVAFVTWWILAGAGAVQCALFGGAILYLAPDGVPRCPSCRYDLRGVTLPARCAECGMLVESAHLLHRSWTIAGVLAILLAVVLSLAFGFMMIGATAMLP